jgi:hypothetical protein
MLWMVLTTPLLLVLAVGVVAAVNSVRFERRVADEMRALAATAGSPGRPRADLARLPAPVARYLAAAIGEDRAPVRAVRVRHGGTFRSRPGQPWLPIRGVQLLIADPPSFVWWGRVRVAPGIWIDARDKLVGGTASMLVRAESTLTLGDAKGPALDQGAAIRVLGEMMWFPTAFLDERYVAWSAIDDRSARATLRLGGHEVSAVFHFGPDGMPARICANRYRDVNGEGVLTPWTGLARDFRLAAGLRVPCELAVVWELESGPFPCMRFTVEEIDIEREEPAPRPGRILHSIP